mgnify:CR=1 FL=1
MFFCSQRLSFRSTTWNFEVNWAFLYDFVFNDQFWMILDQFVFFFTKFRPIFLCLFKFYIAVPRVKSWSAWVPVQQLGDTTESFFRNVEVLSKVRSWNDWNQSNFQIYTDKAIIWTMSVNTTITVMKIRFFCIRNFWKQKKLIIV